jgi:O-antigen ligase
VTSNVAAAPRSAAGGGLSEKYAPPIAIEYLFYAQVLYSIMGSFLGLSIGMLGFGMLVLAAGVCLLSAGTYAPVILTPVLLPIACGVSYLAVQMLVHHRPVGDEYIRDFVPWIVGLIVTQCLALRRGFLHRAALVVLLIGLLTLPFLRTFIGDDTRVGLARGITIGNPNDLGAWFGFCCAYLTLVGLETRRTWLRTLVWLAAGVCLGVIGLTVSRGPLLATAITIAFACRRILKRGFLPLVSLLLAVWVAVGIGVFDAQAARFASRGTEESGRFAVWPRAVARIIDAPVFGVGANDVQTGRSDNDTPITPHNGFIFIALASGMVPFLLFVAYWFRCFVHVRRLGAAGHEDAPFQSALLLYTFLITMNLNLPFTLPWPMITLAAVTGPGFILRASVQGRRLGREALADVGLKGMGAGFSRPARRG